MSTDVIGKDVWWDSEKHIFRKKRIDLEKIPLKFRCPLCGAVMVPPQKRLPQKREITDWRLVFAQNRKALAPYFERDKPAQKDFIAWLERIRIEHENEFMKNVYVEYFEESSELRFNHIFYGIYSCNKCRRNNPKGYAINIESINEEAGL